MKALMLASVASMIDQFNMDNIKTLKELGYQVDVACNFLAGNTSSQKRMVQFQKELERDHISMYDLPIPRKISAISQIIKSYAQLKQLVKEQEYDIVHCHSPIGGVIARMACRKQRKKGLRVIYTAHGFHFFKGAPVRNWLLFYPVEKLAGKYTDVLITICKEDFNRAKSSIPAKQVTYTPGIGIDVEKIKEVPFNPEKRISLGISGQDIMLFSVGELNANKNHEVVIRSIKNLNRKDIHYVVCGKGKLHSYLEDLTKKLQLEGQIHFLGFRTDIYEWLKISDVFVFPSYREGLSVSLMEAMAAGLPVICSNIRGNTDLIEPDKGGYLVAANDVENMAEKIKLLIEKKELCQRFGTYNQEVIKGYSSEKVQHIMRKIYADTDIKEN